MTENNSSRYFSSITVGSFSMRSGGATVQTGFSGCIRIGIRAGNGPASGTSPTTGVYIGDGAAYAMTGSTGYNTIMGWQCGNLSGYQFASGSNVTAIGAYIRSLDGTANLCTAIGAAANIKAASVTGAVAVGVNATAVEGGISIGYAAGDTSLGDHNIAIGRSSLSSATVAISKCIAIGYLALGNANKTSTAVDGTVAVGYYSLKGVTTGSGNVAVGFHSGTAVSTGSNNTLIGYASGTTITTGGTNTYLGSSISAAATSTTGSTAIGYGLSGVASNTIYLACNGGTNKIATTVTRTVVAGAAIPANVDYIDWTVNGVAYKLPLYT